MLTRAAPLRSCASLLALPGARRADLLRHGLNWLCLVSCDHMLGRIVRCVIWKGPVAMLLCLLCCCCSCATLFCLCDRMYELESF